MVHDALYAPRLRAEFKVSFARIIQASGGREPACSRSVE